MQPKLSTDYIIHSFRETVSVRLLLFDTAAESKACFEKPSIQCAQVLVSRSTWLTNRNPRLCCWKAHPEGSGGM